MTTETLDTRPAAPLPTGKGNDWSLRPWALRTVAVLELRQRLRASRWYLVLGAWLLVLGGLTWLVELAVHAAYSGQAALAGAGAAQAEADARSGRVVFAIIVLLVLSLSALVTPALSATGINGDRNAGVLATLQTTLLSPAELAVGKLLAAWAVSVALLVTASPFLVWSLIQGGSQVLRLLVVLAILAVTLLVICAIGLGWSAVTARPAISAVFTYLSVAFLGLGLPLLFVATLPLVNTVEQVTVTEPVSGNGPFQTDADGNPVLDANGNPVPATDVKCQTVTREQPVSHVERSWWLLAASPYVVIADATPPVSDALGSDPLSDLRRTVRELRLPPDRVTNFCTFTPESPQRQAQREALAYIWPYGLAADLLIGVAFTAVAVRRLRAPSRALPRGTRVA
jgi:ABC-type transport system involved in multi-copper enzyme maturation permease subunit